MSRHSRWSLWSLQRLHSSSSVSVARVHPFLRCLHSALHCLQGDATRLSRTFPVCGAPPSWTMAIQVVLVLGLALSGGKKVIDAVALDASLGENVSFLRALHTVRYRSWQAFL